MLDLATAERNLEYCVYLISIINIGYESRFGKKTSSNSFHEKWLSKTLLAQPTSKNFGTFTICSHICIMVIC